jgi:ABC-type bacteriocin/lantibiotic exporter with double-glycine peptidase domain
MNDSVKNNILFGDELTIKNREIFDASLKYSNLNEAVLNFKDGIDTIIGEVGNKVSGGQGQRIGLARAFFHERDVMVFDEATSSLDKELEHKVFDYISSNSSKYTSIIISHNPNVVDYCSNVYEL